MYKHKGIRPKFYTFGWLERPARLQSTNVKANHIKKRTEKRTFPYENTKNVKAIIACRIRKVWAGDISSSTQWDRAFAKVTMKSFTLHLMRSFNGIRRDISFFIIACFIIDIAKEHPYFDRIGQELHFLPYFHKKTPCQHMLTGSLSHEKVFITSCHPCRPYLERPLAYLPYRPSFLQSHIR